MSTAVDVLGLASEGDIMCSVRHAEKIVSRMQCIFRSMSRVSGEMKLMLALFS